VLGIGLLVRQLDLPLCNRWPLGTHFIWHSLTALVLWFTSQAVLVHVRQPARR
jgi:hypothetical protein